MIFNDNSWNFYKKNYDRLQGVYEHNCKHYEVMMDEMLMELYDAKEHDFWVRLTGDRASVGFEQIVEANLQKTLNNKFDNYRNLYSDYDFFHVAYFNDLVKPFMAANSRFPEAATSSTKSIGIKLNSYVQEITITPELLAKYASIREVVYDKFDFYDSKSLTQVIRDLYYTDIRRSLWADYVSRIADGECFSADWQRIYVDCFKYGALESKYVSVRCGIEIFYQSVAKMFLKDFGQILEDGRCLINSPAGEILLIREPAFDGTNYLIKANDEDLYFVKPTKYRVRAAITIPMVVNSETMRGNSVSKTLTVNTVSKFGFEYLPKKIKAFKLES
jgi:hypothetical protein